MGKAIKGVDCKGGFKLETGSWGSGSVELGANDMLPLLSEGIALDKQIATDEILDGKGGKYTHDLTRKLYTGPVSLKGSFEGTIPVLMACVFGSGSVTHVSGSACRHILELTPTHAEAGNDVNHFGTLCFDKDHYIAEYKSTKPSKATLTFTPDANCVIDFDMFSYAFSESSVVNSGSVNWTEKSTKRIRFEHMKVYITQYNKDKASWEADDYVCVSELMLSVDRAPADIITNCSAPYGIEPVDGVREVGLTFTVPTWGPDQATEIRDFTTEIEADTKMMMKIVLEGTDISGGGGEKYTWTFYLPTVYIMKGDANIAGPDLISVTYECRIETPTDASITLMEQGSKNHECVLVITNTDCSPYLA